MPKEQPLYLCQECGLEHRKWLGQCTACHTWNSLKKYTLPKSKSSHSNHRRGYADEVAQVTPLSEIHFEDAHRHASGFSELDRVLGGGFVQGSVTLLSGDPGAGKSTLLMQIIAHFAQQKTVLYITGEESLNQLAERAQRLDIPQENIQIASETCVENIQKIHSNLNPYFVVVDSIQVMYTEASESFAGSVAQTRECAAILTKLAKTTQTTFVLIGHVNKEGNLAGPKVLEHMIDCYLILESSTDARYRFLRSHKNRFGSVHELGVFAMTPSGLKEVANPSAIFLDHKSMGPGSIVTVLWEGSRALLIEIQGLVDEQQGSYPKRVSIGLDNQRLVMILAILNKHCDLTISDQDVFVNLVGGIRISETATDLAVVAAIYSSLCNLELPKELIIFGEIGLSGEVRAIPNGQKRLEEANKQGFRHALIPHSNKSSHKHSNLSIYPIKNIQECLKSLKDLSHQD